MAKAAHEGMSSYEQKAWEQILRDAEDPGVRRFVPEKYRETVASVRERASSVVSRVPVPEVVNATLEKSMAALQGLTTKVGMGSVDAHSRIRVLNAQGHKVSSLEEFRQLDLSACDRLLPKRRSLHLLVGAVEGAATSIAVTGAVVSSTVSGGTTAGVAVGAVAVDVASVLAGLGRIVGEIAASYGYDVATPEEELYALQVIGFAVAGDSAAKTASLAALSRLTQQMMRQATWAELSRHQLVVVIQKVYQQLGLKITHAKLAQVVPVAGVLVSIGLNTSMVERTHRRAQAAYRARFLVEKYGLAFPDAWMTADAVEEEDLGEPVIDVTEVIFAVQRDDADEVPQSGAFDDSAKENSAPPFEDEASSAERA